MANGGDLAAARALAYDVVYNGVEVGGGSMRIHRADVQAAVFKAIGLSSAEARRRRDRIRAYQILSKHGMAHQSAPARASSRRRR